MIPERNGDGTIDAALGSLGRAVPPEGIEGRILTRLASERMRAAGAAESPLWRRFSVPALGFASAGLMGAIIVAGSVGYSHRAKGTPVAAPLTLPGSSQGIGAASAVHLAAPATAPVVAGPQSRGRSAHRAEHGRARVAAHARKARGVTAPVAPPAGPQN
jgi:hypothetical protein